MNILKKNHQFMNYNLLIIKGHQLVKKKRSNEVSLIVTKLDKEM